MPFSSNLPPVAAEGAWGAGQRLFSLLWHESRAATLLWCACIGALVLAGAVLTYAVGGTSLAFLHVLYIPVRLAALRFGARGGVVVGLLAGLSIGPLMPLDVTSGTPQPPAGWVFRTALFVLNGVLLGAAASTLKWRTARAEALPPRPGRGAARHRRPC